MVRLYEKGWEQFHRCKATGTCLPDDFDITRTRFETQLRPPSADKQVVGTFTPAQVFAYSEWVRYTHSLMTGFILATPSIAQRSRSPHARKIANLARQYGLTLKKQMEIDGGSYELLGRTLMNAVAEIDQAAEACKRVLKGKV